MSLAIAQNVIAMRGTALDTLEALNFKTDEVETLRPGLDFRRGHLYMTLPIDRDVPRTVGRGKDKQEVVDRITSTLCVRSAGPLSPFPHVFAYTEDGVKEEGFRFPETFTQAAHLRWPMASLKAYLRGDAPREDPRQLFTDLRQVYVDHIEYPGDVYYDVIPLFVLGSYVYRLFLATGYIHFNGTKNSGKSQNMNLLSAFGLNTVWASNMTPASLFRTVAGSPGIVCVDEAERDNWKSEKGAELRQILLGGYADGTTVARAEKGPGDRFVSVNYEVFAPKILASVDPLDPILQSRCMVVPMQRALRQIPEFDPNEQRWIDLRGRIYTWAMQSYAEIVDLRDTWRREHYDRAPDLTNRSWQIAQMYLVLAEHFGGRALADRLATFFTETFAKAAKQQEDADLQLHLLKCLPRVIATTAPHPGFFYGLKDIHSVAASYLEEDAKEFYKTRSVSRHLGTLGFTNRQKAKGGNHIQILEADIRTMFDRHSVTPFPEDVDWLAKNATYQDPASAPGEQQTLLASTPEPKQEDDYSFLDNPEYAL